MKHIAYSEHILEAYAYCIESSISESLFIYCPAVIFNSNIGFNAIFFLNIVSFFKFYRFLFVDKCFFKYFVYF